MRKLWTRLTDWLDRIDGAMMIAAAALLVALLVLVKTINEVVKGETDWLDHRLIEWIATLNPPRWVEEIMRDCTALGGIFVLSFVSLAVITYLLARRQRHAVILVLVAVVGALILSTTLKGLFHRDRPTILEHRSVVMTSSFPSGHAMLSATVWLTLGVMLARLEKSPYLKAYFILLGLFISFVVGISRVWLGVHWPTDVIAGWAAGSVWAVLCYFFTRFLQRRGTVESPNGQVEADPTRGN